MPGHDVAAEFVANLQRALEVEPGAGSPVFGRGHAERLGGGVDIEPGFVSLDAGRHHGEANAIAGDRGAVSDGSAVETARDAQPVQLALRRRRQSDDLADVSDYAGEHQM